MRLLHALAVVVAVTSYMPRSGAEVGPQTTFRSGIDVVRLDVLVTVRGRPVTGLTPRDFEVLDNGVAQRVNLATEGGPIEIALVLDTSGSVAGEPLDQLVAASQSAAAELVSGDRASLVTFSTRVSLEANAVPDPTVMRAILSRTRAAGRTVLWDALFMGLSLVAHSPARSLVLLFTDGVDNGSWLGRDEVIDAMTRTESVVYAVRSRLPLGIRGPAPFPASPDLMASASRDRERKAWADLRRVVQESGGEVFEAESGTSLGTQFGAILRQFRSRYLLSYEPTGVPRGDGWHRVEVRVKSRDAKVGARRGYFAGGRLE